MDVINEERLDNIITDFSKLVMSLAVQVYDDQLLDVQNMYNHIVHNNLMESSEVEKNKLVHRKLYQDVAIHASKVQVESKTIQANVTTSKEEPKVVEMELQPIVEQPIVPDSAAHEHSEQASHSESILSSHELEQLLANNSNDSIRKLLMSYKALEERLAAVENASKNTSTVSHATIPSTVMASDSPKNASPSSQNKIPRVSVQLSAPQPELQSPNLNLSSIGHNTHHDDSLDIAASQQHSSAPMIMLDDELEADMQRLLSDNYMDTVPTVSEAVFHDDTQTNMTSVSDVPVTHLNLAQLSPTMNKMVISTSYSPDRSMNQPATPTKKQTVTSPSKKQVQSPISLLHADVTPTKLLHTQNMLKVQDLLLLYNCLEWPYVLEIFIQGLCEKETQSCIFKS